MKGEERLDDAYEGDGDEEGKCSKTAQRLLFFSSGARAALMRPSSKTTCVMSGRSDWSPVGACSASCPGCVEARKIEPCHMTLMRLRISAPQVRPMDAVLGRMFFCPTES